MLPAGFSNSTDIYNLEPSTLRFTVTKGSLGSAPGHTSWAGLAAVGQRVFMFGGVDEYFNRTEPSRFPHCLHVGSEN